MMKKTMVWLPILFLAGLFTMGVGGQTPYQDADNYHFCHRCGMAIPKTAHVITVEGVPEEPWYQCCPTCALMDIIESGNGNGLVHAFDDTDRHPITLEIRGAEVISMTPPDTLLLLGGSCLKNKIFTNRTNAMGFIAKNDWTRTDMLKPIDKTFAKLKDKSQAINRCAMCANPLAGHEKTTMILMAKSKKRLLSCCAHCGLLMAHKLKDDLIRAVTPDFKTGRMIDAKKAYYVVDNDLMVCCFPSTIAFADRGDAQGFQTTHKGAIMTFEQALADMSKVMGK